jgi:hypothetical protein
MAKTEEIQYYNFMGKAALAGGLNVSDNPLIVGPADMTQADNIAISQSLSRKKRPGKDLYHTSTFASTASYPATGVAIRAILDYWRYTTDAVATQSVFLHQDDKVWNIPGRSSPGSDVTGALSLMTTGVPSYQVFEGILYFCSTNVADGYNKFDGTNPAASAAVTATPPSDGPGKYLGIFAGRMVMAGQINFPFRVYISAPLDAETWTGVGTTSFDLDYDGDPEGVTAIFGQLEGRLYIATRRSIYEITASDPDDVATYSVSAVTKGIGCVGGHMFCRTANDILFWSDRGLHSLRKTITSDQTEITFLSRDIQRLVTNSLAPNLLSQGQCVWDQVQNLCITTVASSGQTTNDTLLIYNLVYNLWTVWIGVNARSLSPLLVNNKQYVMTGGENGEIGFLNPDSKTDNGTGFAGRFKTGKIFPGGDIMTQKSFKSVTVLVSSTNVSTVNVGWAIDGLDGIREGRKQVTIGQTGALLGQTFVLGASRLGVGRYLPLTFSIEDYGYNIQLDISVSGDSDFEFYGFVLGVSDADQNFTA